MQNSQNVSANVGCNALWNRLT